MFDINKPAYNKLENDLTCNGENKNPYIEENEIKLARTFPLLRMNSSCENIQLFYPVRPHVLAAG